MGETQRAQVQGGGPERGVLALLSAAPTLPSARLPESLTVHTGFSDPEVPDHPNLPRSLGSPPFPMLSQARWYLKTTVSLIPWVPVAPQLWLEGIPSPLMSSDPFSCSCCCPSVPGKSISQTQANLTTITTRVRSPAGPGPRTWMTWRVRTGWARAGALGGALASL